MNTRGIRWLGTRTEHFNEMLAFARDLLGLRLVLQEPGSAVFDFPNGDRLEIFGADDAEHQHFRAPVAGFELVDIDAAREELGRAGIRFFGPTQRGSESARAHFEAPDGNVYELTTRR